MKGHCHPAKQPLNSSKYEGQNHTRIHKVTLESLEDRFTILWNFVSWFPSGIFIDFWGQKGSPCLFTAWLKVLIFQWLSGDSTDSTHSGDPPVRSRASVRLKVWRSGWATNSNGPRKRLNGPPEVLGTLNSAASLAFAARRDRGSARMIGAGNVHGESWGIKPAILLSQRVIMSYPRISTS